MTPLAGISETTDVLQFRDPAQPNISLIFWQRTPARAGGRRNVLFWIHGVGEHSGRYRSFAHELLGSTPTLDGVACYDQRGHGVSAGARGAVSTIDCLLDDFVQHVSPRMAMEFGTACRIVIGGHSLGGILAAASCQRADWLRADGYGNVCGVLLSGPAVQIIVAGTVNRILAPVAGLLARVPGVRGLCKSNGIDSGKLTHSLEKRDELEKDDLAHDIVGLGLATDLLTIGKEVVEHVKAAPAEECLLKQVGFLILHGELDGVCDAAGSRRLVEAAGDKAELIVIPKAFHEMHNEDEEHGRDKFMEAASAFLTKAFAEGE